MKNSDSTLGMLIVEYCRISTRTDLGIMTETKVPL